MANTLVSCTKVSHTKVSRTKNYQNLMAAMLVRIMTFACFKVVSLKTAMRKVLLVPFSILLLSPLLIQPAYSSNESTILQQCRDLSLADNDIHNCLDNYLDLMDENLADLLDFITAELAEDASNPEALQALQRSQQAFENFRTENCLWYLAFSSPREQAEQIAKNCLASMSEDRLSELQRLSKSTQARDSQPGYFVYGVDRNSFIACGSTLRLWVEGDSAVVGELQQRYLNESTAELQVLYVDLIGSFDTSNADSYAGHDGVFNIESINALRLPTDGDCAPPSGLLTQTESVEEEPTTDAGVAEETVNIASNSSDPLPQNADPEQSLTAYFGDWVALCEQLGSSYGCVLTAPLLSTAVESSSDADQTGAVLRITRRSEQRTIVDIDFPLELGPVIADVDQITWRVDSLDLGKISHSQLAEIAGRGVHVGKSFVSQNLRERWYIRDELLPLLLDGRDLYLTVDGTDDTQTVLSATLNGLTRALTFADDFTAAEGNI